MAIESYVVSVNDPKRVVKKSREEAYNLYETSSFFSSSTLESQSL